LVIRNLNTIIIPEIKSPSFQSPFINIQLPGRDIIEIINIILDVNLTLILEIRNTILKIKPAKKVLIIKPINQACHPSITIGTTTKIAA
jgi:hypothetical protein